jgi:small-conductance mechanosensitive channel
MIDVVKWMNDFLVGKMGLHERVADFLDDIILVVGLTFIGFGINWIFQTIFRLLSKHDMRFLKSRWRHFLSSHKTGTRILLLIPGIVIYLLIDYVFAGNEVKIRFLHRIDVLYLIVVAVMITKAVLLSFLDAYSTTEKSRFHPLKGLIQGVQVILYLLGGIIALAVLLDKSPAVLLTGLGASAAVLMLIFKDSILGLVAGVQLSQNDMVRIGDWIQMPDGSANGNVEEITLNTVKVRNWDNTISMIPPYTLVSTTFKNWRGMQESGGRRVDKCIYIDINSLEVYSPDMIEDLYKSISLMGRIQADLLTEEGVTNIQLYRIYITQYLRNHPEVNQSLDMIITQKEATVYGLPVEVYFFLNDKSWASFEKKQSDIFDHLLAMAPEFGLKLYQRP